jgi:hypothetical protein
MLDYVGMSYISVAFGEEDLAFEPIDLDVEPRLHQFNFKNNGHITIQLSNVTL